MKETTERPGGPAGLFLRAAAVPLAVVLALAGQVVLSRGGGPTMSLLPGAAIMSAITDASTVFAGVNKSSGGGGTF